MLSAAGADAIVAVFAVAPALGALIALAPAGGAGKVNCSLPSALGSQVPLKVTPLLAYTTQSPCFFLLQI